MVIYSNSSKNGFLHTVLVNLASMVFRTTVLEHLRVVGPWPLGTHAHFTPANLCVHACVYCLMCTLPEYVVQLLGTYQLFISLSYHVCMYTGSYSDTHPCKFVKFKVHPSLKVIVLHVYVINRTYQRGPICTWSVWVNSEHTT